MQVQPRTGKLVPWTGAIEVTTRLNAKEHPQKTDRVRIAREVPEHGWRLCGQDVMERGDTGVARVNELPRSGITILATGVSPWNMFTWRASPVRDDTICAAPTGLGLARTRFPRASARGSGLFRR